MMLLMLGLVPMRIGYNAAASAALRWQNLIGHRW
jgi:hypothetical protein